MKTSLALASLFIILTACSNTDRDRSAARNAAKPQSSAMNPSGASFEQDIARMNQIERRELLDRLSHWDQMSSSDRETFMRSNNYYKNMPANRREEWTRYWNGLSADQRQSIRDRDWSSYQNEQLQNSESLETNSPTPTR